MPFYATIFNLRSKVDLIWTRCIRPVKAQFVQLNKITKKLNIDLCPFFCHWKEGLFLLKSWNKNMGVTALVFAAGQHAQKVCTTCASSDFERGLGRVSKWNVCERGKKALKNRFSRIYIEISQLERNGIKMVLKWESKWDSTSLTSTIDVLLKKVELSNTLTACVMHISNTLGNTINVVFLVGWMLAADVVSFRR